MRQVLLILLLFCSSCRRVTLHQHKSAPAAIAQGKTFELGLSNFEGELYFFETTRAKLDAAPEWLDRAEFPPLSPRQAMSAALKEAKRLRPDIEKWFVDYVSLQNSEGYWLYNVRLCRADIAVAGLPPVLDIPVLMNGEVVQGVKNLK